MGEGAAPPSLGVGWGPGAQRPQVEERGGGAFRGDFAEAWPRGPASAGRGGGGRGARRRVTLGSACMHVGDLVPAQVWGEAPQWSSGRWEPVGGPWEWGALQASMLSPKGPGAGPVAPLHQRGGGGRLKAETPSRDQSATRPC